MIAFNVGNLELEINIIKILNVERELRLKYIQSLVSADNIVLVYYTKRILLITLIKMRVDRI